MILFVIVLKLPNYRGVTQFSPFKLQIKFFPLYNDFVNNCSKLFSFSDKMSFFVTLNFAFCCLSWSHTFLLSVKNLIKQPNYQNLNCYSGMLEPDLPLEPPISGRSVNPRTIRDSWLTLFQPGGIFWPNVWDRFFC